MDTLDGRIGFVIAAILPMVVMILPDTKRPFDLERLRTMFCGGGFFFFFGASATRLYSRSLAKYVWYSVVLRTHSGFAGEQATAEQEPQ